MPEFKNRENARHTLEDGRVVWESRSCAVACIIEAFVGGERYVALGRRGPKTPDPEFRGKFGLVCGYIDWDESAFEAALREIWEELGLDVSDPEIWHFERQPYYVSTDPSPPNHRQNITLRYFFTISCDELPELSAANCEDGEISELAWVKTSEAIDMDLAFRHAASLKSYLMRVWA
jgi:8-oxo-dGTP pyrophosphatase MutT (NUDIX family)